MNFTDEEKREAKRIGEQANRAIRLFLFARPNGGKVEFDPEISAFLLNGVPVTAVTMRRILLDIEKSAGRRARQHSEDYINGKISLEEWRKRMSDTVSGAHWLAAALAVGSLLKAANNPVLETDISTQRLYLSRFADDVRAGKVSEAKLKSRAASYMLAVAVTFWRTDLREKTKIAQLRQRGIVVPTRRGNPIFNLLGLNRGYTQARRTRRATESCPACVQYSGYWMPIAEMPSIGSLDCGTRCRCYIEYR